MKLIDCEKNWTLATSLNPWTLIGLMFALQSLGSIFVTIYSGLHLRQLIGPIALLLVGMIHAFAVRLWMNSSYVKWKQHWVPALIYCVFIFLLSNRSFRGTQTIIDVNFFHPLEYATLALFFCWMGHPMLGSGKAINLSLRVFWGGFAFAVLDEIHQSFIPARTPSWSDVALDCIGLLCGIGIFFAARNLWEEWEKAQITTEAMRN